ncbi:DNA/RNA polymerase [Lentinula boryana]|uniref:DNA-directed RNA polymerase n=1 Tax=Lentinula boryana TaxID=40481 RepID=A0ABQ8QS11_9AGAR|nr:DNA/RNA polymerase [Lentinula boryana]
MENFLQNPPRYTFLPTPLPSISSSASAKNSSWLTDSATQDSLAVIDACLYQLFDVPRAKGIFDRLRRDTPGKILDVRMYNAFLEAYVNMATSKAADNREFWIECAWELFATMEAGQEKIELSAGTYSIMLKAWLRFGPDSPDHIPDTGAVRPTDILTSILSRDIPVENVVADRVFETSEEAAEVIKLLSKAAAELGHTEVITQLGQTEAIGAHYDDILHDVPEVMPVMRVKKKEPSEASTEDEEQEPEYEVPFNLSNLRRHLSRVCFARRVLPEDVAARQKLLEDTVYETAMDRLKHESDMFEQLGLDTGHLRQPDLRRWMWDWHTKLQDRLNEEIQNIKLIEDKKEDRLQLSPYLSLVKPERLSLITIFEIMRLQGSGGVSEGMKTTRALIAVGKAVENEYKAQICKKNNIDLPTIGRVGNNGYFSNLGYNSLLERRIVAARHMSDGEAWTAAWTQATRAKIGGILVECLMDVAKVTRSATHKVTNEVLTEVQPAFHHTYEHSRGQKLGVIRLNPVVSERLSNDNVRDTIHPRHLPMLVKPKPWLGLKKGGYMFSEVSAMRFKESVEQQSYLNHASELGNVELVYAGLDVLGSTPWQISRKVFDVVLKVWNSGEKLGKLPPAVFSDPEPVLPEGADIKTRTTYIHRMKGWTQAKANNHSDRCSVNYKIEIARTFLGDTIYFPHNVDFRGRAYPIPPHLNHIGNDLSRGLLIFAESKPLGERGLRWLQIHLANLYGYDKANFDERVQFVQDHLDDIFDSATKPLEGRQWWTHADDPWQCLGTCMELHAALTSENPTEYQSCLPVHQDGTCNGLQHYAALGGDSRGAQQVNLSAGERPSDVYTYVGNMAEEIIKRDIANGEKYAAMLQGKITRKIVKQTVMTTVYGVTFIGAREQIERQLKLTKQFEEEEVWGASAYLAKVVLSCIGDLFTGAKDIQLWLTLCARLISKAIPGDRIAEALAEYRARKNKKSKSRGRKKKPEQPHEFLRKEQMTSVVWTTPLGLPIVQPYRKPNRKQIVTSMQTVYISDPNSPSEVNTMKQASAFPPNFIHSLDATHMMLTALECRTQGLTFAAVHDSYWTHACDIDEMSGIIRDTFIALHSSDVLKKLYDEFKERYRNYKIPLASIHSGVLAKALKQAGARITVTPEQAKSLQSFSNLVDVSDTGDSSIQENADSADLKALLVDLAEEREAAKLTQESNNSEEHPEEEAEEEDEFEEDDWESPRAKAARLRKANEDLQSIELLGKFVNLVDLLPPLPKKGDFKVEAIKASQYFFS